MWLAACSFQARPFGEDGVSAVGLTPGEWVALSKPGPSHKLLASFVGDWDVTVTFWSNPEASGESSSGKSKISWILGDRFLQEQFSGTVGGGEYQGLGIMGYDNGSRAFKTVWVDSLNTALTTSSGRYQPDTSTFLFESQLYDPLASGVKTIQSQLQVNSPNSYTFTMTDTSPEGKRFTSLEMRYRRISSGE
jgi:hypothetical protein